MSILAKRLNRLERFSTGKGRIIVINAGAGHTDADFTRAVEAHGIKRNPSDRVVCFRTVYEDRKGKDIAADFPPVVTSVT